MTVFRMEMLTSCIDAVQEQGCASQFLNASTHAYFYNVYASLCKFNKRPLHDVLFNMFANNGGSIDGPRTMKNATTELLSRKKGIEEHMAEHSGSAVFNFNSGGHVCVQVEVSTEGNEMILNLKWNLSTKQYTIYEENSWNVILERYLK